MYINACTSEVLSSSLSFSSSCSVTNFFRFGCYSRAKHHISYVIVLHYDVCLFLCRDVWFCAKHYILYVIVLRFLLFCLFLFRDVGYCFVVRLLFLGSSLYGTGQDRTVSDMGEGYY